MNKQTRLKIMLAVIGFVAVVVGLSRGQRDTRQAVGITSVAGLKQIGLSFRWERNTMARFTAEGERLNLPENRAKQ
jgi:hypothetical protein